MQTVNPKTIKFITLGCKVNQYDTQSIREEFLNEGFQESDNGYPADIYVVNTCTVTQAVDSESLSLIRLAIRESPKAKIIVTGCLTELDEKRIQNLNAQVIIVKNRDKENILEHLPFLNPVRDTTHLDINTPVSNGVNAPRQITYFKGHTRAFLKIQDGCNNFCSYCKVPLVRGASQSKPLDEIIKEASKLIENGFKELVLCGICLGSYGKDLVAPVNLIDVINALEKIDGVFRIRLSSIEAGDVQDELIQKIACSKKMCRHLHIPIQSGDDGILKRMNRSYKRGDYLNLIARIKNNLPGVSITTDVMVGFPGENNENFQNTVRLIKDILPLRTHIFPYSRREGTSAARNFKGGVDHKIIKERAGYLREIARECASKFKREFLNKSMEVLIEGASNKVKGYWQGYTDNYIKVKVKSELNLKNQFIFLRLKEIPEDCMIAELVG